MSDYQRSLTRHRWNRTMPQRPTRMLLAAATTALLLLTIPAGAAQSAVGEATASAFRFNPDAPTQGEAYLLGFRQNATNPSSHQWSFQADQVSVSVTTRHYAGYQETRNDTTTTLHDDASGVLLERYPLAYLMATSTRPDDREATFQLSLDLPSGTLEPRNEINYDSITDGGAPLPVFGDIFDGEDPGSTQPVVSLQQPWPNLARRLSNYEGAITLRGDFALHLYDVLFKIQDGSGDTSTYNVTYGGWRGMEPGQPEAPPTEWDVRYAELAFTNATFTFYPQGRPLELYLRSAGLNLAGQLLMRDAQGQLQDAAGIQRNLGGSLVEIDALDLQLNAWPQSHSWNSLPQVHVAFSGSIASATVDGRTVPLDAPVIEPARQDGPRPASTSPGLGAIFPLPWWLLLAAGLAVSAVAIWYGRRQYHARLNPEFLLRQGHFAHEEGLITKALSLVNSVLRYHPEDTSAVALRAMLFLERKQIKEMLAYLKPFLNGPADDQGALSILYCVALRHEEGDEEARKFILEATKKFPNIFHVAESNPQYDLKSLLSPQGGREETRSYM